MMITVDGIEDYDRIISFSTSRSVADGMKEYSKGSREIFLMLMLDSKNKLITKEIISVGSIDGTVVYAREVVKVALKANAASVIFIHNHPSGDCSPSETDKKITTRLVYIFGMLDITVLDHIVLGLDTHFSFADTGHISEAYQAFHRDEHNFKMEVT